MGKSLTQQKRGKGSPTYKANSFNYAAQVTQILQDKALIVDIINSIGHSAPLLKVKYKNNQESLMVAPEGVKIGDYLEKGKDVEVRTGNTLPLSKVPEGVFVFNIEVVPGDGGKLVRTSGTTARIVSKIRNKVILKLPSGKQKEFNPKCMATVGVVAGSGRIEKPYLKAGNRMKSMYARGKYWPIVSGASMNAVDHPFGGSRSSRKGRPTIAPKNAPPGRKVGMLKPKHTGRNK
ncbi:MAG: 50S ribosomal protein L2 [DPANN group archaeon]|nr:50S ribosomal protein L2 [DPANN group archaeon]